MSLTGEEQALTLLAAVGHDLDHDGHVNPKSDPLFNEEKSFQIMEPLLREAGLTEGAIARVHTILLTTSPDGPHAVLKSVAAAQREGRVPEASEVDPAGRFPELRVLARDKTLTQMAAMVSDADLYSSSGAGLTASQVMSAALTEERRREDPAADLTGDRARKFFLDNIVGKGGYASAAGRAVAGAALEALRAETERRVTAGPSLS